MITHSTPAAGRRYRHLGPFSGLVDAAASQRPLFPVATPGPDTRRKAREILSFSTGMETAQQVALEDVWISNDLHGELLSWSVGFGPRTEAWILKPIGASRALPGVVALHDHGHFKFFGKEKIADGPEGPPTSLDTFRSIFYGGRAFANRLARSGFVVLVHDVFLWGSRRFPLDVMPEMEQSLSVVISTRLEQESAGEEIARYNGAAYLHEHLISKYCNVLGSTFAGIIAYEDRIALDYLRSRPDVDATRVGSVGLSGGGARAALLRATSEDVAATVIVGMMSTYQGLLDKCIAPHTWMFFPPGWSAHGDWPDLAAAGAPAPLLIQYLSDDQQFTIEGMEGADARVAAHYAARGARDAYTGTFFPGPHRFDVAMQEQAFEWLARHLGGRGRVDARPG
jgi:dienelactone hydrolase